MTTSDWIVLGVGGYAAIVASAALIWNIVRERRRVIIRIGSLEWMSDLEENLPMFSVHIINKTRRGVNINAVGFIFTDGVRFNLATELLKVPKQIPGEDTCTFYVKINDVKNVARNLNKTFKRFCVEDGTGRLYKIRMPKLTLKALNK